MSVEIQRHNETVLASLEPGDAVEFKRGLYSHWAVYAGQDWYWFGLIPGDSKVIHLTGDGANIASAHAFSVCGESFEKAIVKMDNFWDVANDSKAYKDKIKDYKYSNTVILQRAKMMIGPIAYNILWRNCEHFVSYCRYGEWRSEQVQSFQWKFFWICIVISVALLAWGLQR